MEQKVAVEGELAPFRDALERAGYRVVPLDEERLGEVAAVVVNGMDDDLLGIETVEAHAPVIDADGRTPDEVVAEVRDRAIGSRWEFRPASDRDPH